MAVHKVIEILAQSEKSWEDAAQAAVTEASKTVRNIESIYVHEMTAKVDQNLITYYRVNVKITFAVD
jgi:dodecin